MSRSSLSSLTYRVARNEILDELRAAVDDADLELILSVFKTDADAQFSDLQAFATAGQHEPARRVAHRLAGLLAQFGATEAAELAHRMAASTSNPGDAEAVAALLSSSRKAVEDICSCIDESVPVVSSLSSPALKTVAQPTQRPPQTLPPQLAADLAMKAALQHPTHRRRSETPTAPPDG
jgi:HPt (histidine-containing phosphotransfer) domain-containing protein